MKSLVIEDLITGLDDLFEKRADSLVLADSGKVYTKLLTKLQAGLLALPPEQRGLPLKELLKSADGRFDGWARGLHYLGLAIRSIPVASPALLKAAEAITNEVVPSLDLTRQAYAREVSHAREVGNKQSELEPVLAPVPTPDARTLDAWVADMVTAGAEIGQLLSDRGDAMTSRGPAGALRMRTVGVLGQLRDHLALALEANPELPRTLDNDVFGMFDQLEGMAVKREQSSQASETTKGDSQPPSETSAPS